MNALASNGARMTNSALAPPAPTRRLLDRPDCQWLRLLLPTQHAHVFETLEDACAVWRQQLSGETATI